MRATRLLPIITLAVLAVAALPRPVQSQGGEVLGYYPGPSQDPNIRRRYMPVTLTQQGWRAHATELLYPGFRLALARFSFYGALSPNRMLVGKRNTISFDATTASVSRLCRFLPQTGTSGSLRSSYVSPWGPTEAGALAGEAVALTLNIAYNDERLMPRQPGYDLELFSLASGPFRGRTVGQVLDMANRILGGDSPRSYGLPNADAMAAILRAINSNYEFTSYAVFWDRGYLNPNRYGISDPPHPPHVP